MKRLLFINLMQLIHFMIHTCNAMLNTESWLTMYLTYHLSVLCSSYYPIIFYVKYTINRWSPGTSWSSTDINIFRKDIHELTYSSASWTETFLCFSRSTLLPAIIRQISLPSIFFNSFTQFLTCKGNRNHKGNLF